MVIWSRWGILGVLIPMAFIALAISVLKPSGAENLKPLKKVKLDEDTEDDSTAKELEKLKESERKRAAERIRATKRAELNGYLIGGLVSAAVLWPLGRWMNKCEVRILLDQQTGQSLEAQVGGGHTLFFIPLEYWSFIWAAICLLKLLTSTE